MSNVLYKTKVLLPLALIAVITIASACQGESSIEEKKLEIQLENTNAEIARVQNNLSVCMRPYVGQVNAEQRYCRMQANQLKALNSQAQYIERLIGK